MNNNNYQIQNILPANETALLKDVYLIALYAAKIPPHLAISINGKLFTLTVKGPMVNGELTSLLKLIKKNRIETIFIQLSLPEIFSLKQLQDEITKHTLSYPKVDIDIATCLSPIKDFCSSIYEVETKNINFLYDLLPRLFEQKIISSCWQLNLDHLLNNNTFILKKYSMNDIYEGIRSSQMTIA